MYTPGVRTLLEIRGTPCFNLDNTPTPRQTILTSRTFGQAIRTLDHLQKAVASFVTIAAEKLRSQNSIANFIKVFIMTNRFDPQDFYHESILIELPQATAYTPHLIRAALNGLQQIFQPNLAYKRAGVLLLDITADDPRQLNIWSNAPTDRAEQSLMQSIDNINQHWGRHTLRFASTGTNKRPPAIRNYQAHSPRYTTRWDELMVINN